MPYAPRWLTCRYRRYRMRQLHAGTRAIFAQKGVGPDQFLRIEGVADREPYVPKNRFDPRNRRMSITLGWARE